MKEKVIDLVKTKRIFAYVEDVPARKDVVTHGMSRAGPPILRSIIDHIDRIAVFPRHRWHGRQDLDPELASLCEVAPRAAAISCKILRKLGMVRIANRLSVQFSVPAARSSTADVIFAYIGTDAGLLNRTAKLAQLSGKTYALYLVDDFIASLRISGIDENSIERTHIEAGAALRGANYVFAISSGLGDQLLASFGVRATTLPLAFEQLTAVRPLVKMQIIYVGSINFLYSAGILDLFNVVERARHDSGFDIRVRLTTAEEAARRELGELPCFVLAAPESTAEGLAREIASSLFAFLPYSFGARERPMVSTSFPSKSMEYLAYARSIVVYGPDYGVATQCFQEAGLSFVVSSLRQLEEVVRLHLSSRPDHSCEYRKYLEGSHSLTVVRNILCGVIGLETGE